MNPSPTIQKIKSHKEDLSRHFEKCLSLCCFPPIIITFSYTLTRVTEIDEVILIHDEAVEADE